jgi:hypothetical protein
MLLQHQSRVFGWVEVDKFIKPKYAKKYRINFSFSKIAFSVKSDSVSGRF